MTCTVIEDLQLMSFCVFTPETFQSRRKKSSSRENVYDEGPSKAKGGQRNPTPPGISSGRDKWESRDPSAPPSSANAAAIAASDPMLDYPDSGSIPAMPAQRMIDPPDLFNTKGRDKPLPR